MAKIGEIFIQRVIKDSEFTTTGYSAEESRFWVCSSAKYPTYGFKCEDKEIQCRKLQIDNLGCITIRKKYQEKGYSTILESAQKFHCFPLTNYHKAHVWMQKFHVKLGHPIPVLIKEPTEKPVETSKDCPILSRVRSSLSVESMEKLFEGEKSMLDLEEEELADVPKDDEGYETDVESPTEDNMVDYDTPKRKRSDSVEVMPPTPKKKRMVGRFTISSQSPIPEIVNEVITEVLSSTHCV